LRNAFVVADMKSRKRRSVARALGRRALMLAARSRAKAQQDVYTEMSVLKDLQQKQVHCKERYERSVHYLTSIQQTAINDVNQNEITEDDTGHIQLYTEREEIGTFSTVNFLLSTVNCQLSAVNFLLSTFDCQSIFTKNK